jgi:signal transduction histidine kinase
LDRAVSRISRFTADASHELRTPLAVIRGTAEVALRRSRSAPEYRDALDQVASESQHMTALIEDLLFLARSDADALDLPMSVLDLAPVVVDVCSRMQLLAEQNHVRLHCGVPANGTAIVRANEEAVRRLLVVLIDNAIKYSQPNGTVVVNVSCIEKEVRLAVQDSGPGIPDTELQRIFERFYRSPAAREAASRGEGLGLSLAASIAHHHSAAITVSSTPNLGSTFAVTFQLAATAFVDRHQLTSGVV